MLRQCMGVINITPDSFSDGGKISDISSLVERITSLKNAGAQIIDIGAQSTAPTCKPISQNEEIERFEKFLVPLISTWDGDLTLSIDTFRPMVFKWLYDKNPNLNWIFNDVSGHLEEKILEECPNARIVLGHNLCNTREDAPEHMKYILPHDEDLIDSMEKFFKKQNLYSRVIIDPLFGFSKSFEQNLELLDKLPELIKRFSLNQEFLIGISKKSFLRKMIPESKNPLEDSENLHQYYLTNFIKEIDQPVIYRVHNPKIFYFAQS